MTLKPLPTLFNLDKYPTNTEMGSHAVFVFERESGYGVAMVTFCVTVMSMMFFHLLVEKKCCKPMNMELSLSGTGMHQLTNGTQAILR